MNMERPIRIIISGGGTGGHIFPAISIANAIKELQPDAQLLFVGAEGKMEMQRVPDAGYGIIGLPVAGFDRRNLLKNVSVLVKLFRSQLKARRIIRQFQPDVAVGVGGYASGPLLKSAGMMGIPTLIQEQNSYAGITNKLLAGHARKICVAYDNMEKFFPGDKIILTGNPVRQDLVNSRITREDALRPFNFDPAKKTILILVGALAAYLKVPIKDLPVVASAPELQHEKAVSIGVWAVALGLMTHISLPPPVLGSPLVSQVLTEGIEGITGGKFYVEGDPHKAAAGILAHIMQKRKGLGL